MSSIRGSDRVWLASLILVAGCGAAVTPETDTGLTGTVARGPIRPVCLESEPCEGPFAASFAVLRRGRRVAGFQSDSAGQFEVRLAPGQYQVVPGDDAPILAPSAQAKTVEIGPVGLTAVALHFDTGIR